MGFWGEVGFLIMVVLIFGVSIPTAAVYWLQQNIIVLGIVLLLKSAFCVGRSLLADKQCLSYYTFAFLTLSLDVARNGVFLYCFTPILSGMFENGLFGLLVGFIGLIFGGGLLIVASEGPAYLVSIALEDMPKTKKPLPTDLFGSIFGVCCGLEVVSIVVMGLLSWIL